MSWLSRAAAAVFAIVMVLSLASPWVAPAAVDTALAATGTIDDFDDGDLSEYSGATGQMRTTTSRAQAGTHSLETEADNTFERIHSSSGLDNYPEDGDTFEYYVYVDNDDSEIRARMQYGMGNPSAASYDDINGYTILLNDRKGTDDVFTLHKRDGSTNVLATTNLDSPEDEWLKVEVAWGTNGDHNVTLYNSAGNALARINASDSSFTSGAIGWGADDLDDTNGEIFFDSGSVVTEEGKQTVSGFVLNGSASGIDSATVVVDNSTDGSRVTSTTTSSDGSYSVSLADGDYTITASKTGFLNTSKSITVSSTRENVNITLSDSPGPYVTSATPAGDEYVRNRTTQLEATVEDPDNDDVTVEFLLLQPNGSFVSLGLKTVASGATAKVDAEAKRGSNRWYVNLTAADGESTTSQVYRFFAPHSIRVFNGSSLQLLDDRTVDATITSTQTSYRVEKSTSDGVVDLNGAPNEPLLVKLEATDYLDQSLIIGDPWLQDYALMYPAPNSSIPGASKTYNQTFSLDDKTGNFPAEDSFLLVQAYYNGQWQTVASDKFGSVNRATVTLKDGETYRLKVTDTTEGSDADDLNVREVGEFTGNKDFEDDVIPIVINKIEDDGDLTGEVNQPPIAAFNYTPQSPTNQSPIEFDAAEASDPDGEIAGFEWDFDSDGVIDARGEETANNYSTAGVKNVTLTVVDNDNAEDEITRSIFLGRNASLANAAPRADFNYQPKGADPGQTVTFNGSDSTDPEGNISTFEWDFDNDGSYEATGLEAEKAFPSSGNFQVALRVTDNVSHTDIETKVVSIGKAGAGGADDVANTGYRWDAFAQSCLERNSAGTCIDYARNWSGSSDRLVFTFEAGSDAEVSNLNVTMYELGNRNNNTIYDAPHGSTNSLVVTQPLSESQTNKTWVVEWSAEINGEEVGGQRVIGQRPPEPWPDQLPDWVIEYAGMLVIIMTGLSASRFNAERIAVVTSVVGGFVWYLGAIDAFTSASMVVFALFVGLLTKWGRDAATPG